MRYQPVLFLILAGILVTPPSVFGQAPSRTPLPGCCLQASGWTSPSLSVGSGVAVDRTLKRVYVTDGNTLAGGVTGVIKAFNYDGSPVTSFGGGAGQVAMSSVFAVAVGPCDYPGVYAVNRSISPTFVDKFDQDGNLVWTSPTLPFGGEFFICLDDYGNSYVSDGNSVYVLDNNGNLKTTITGSGSWAMNNPTGVFAQGLQLYVADSGNNRILQFIQTGVNTYSYNPAQAVTLSTSQPYGMTQDLDGNFYVAFQNSNGYQIYDGQFNSIGPLCAPASGTLLAAFGIAVDETGAVYVADHSGLPAVVKMQACYSQPAFYNCYKGSNPPTTGESFVFPSPARGGQASFSYDMAESGRLDLKIWNQNGEKTSEITDRKPSGVQVTPFSLAGFAPGLYFYKAVLTYDSGRAESLQLGKFAVIR